MSDFEALKGVLSGIFSKYRWEYDSFGEGSLIAYVKWLPTEHKEYYNLVLAEIHKDRIIVKQRVGAVYMDEVHLLFMDPNFMHDVHALAGIKEIVQIHVNS